MKHVPQTVYKSHQAQPMGWISLMIFTRIIHLWIDARNVEQWTSSVFFKKAGFWSG